MRASGAAGAAVRQRHRRPPPPGRNRASGWWSATRSRWSRWPRSSTASGWPTGTARTLAVLVLAVFGVALIWPAAWRVLEAPLQRLARFGPQDSGRWLLVGARWSAARWASSTRPAPGRSWPRSWSRAPPPGAPAGSWPWPSAYGIGSGAGAVRAGARRPQAARADRRAGRGPALQRALGVVLVLTAVAMATAARRALPDRAGRPPAAVRASTPTGGFERSAAARDAPGRPARRGQVRPRDRRGQPRPGRRGPGGATWTWAPRRTSQGGGRWFNTRRARWRCDELRGRVVLVDFWTYTCINCIRTLPHLTRLGRALPRLGPDGRGRAHARVRVRAQDRPTCARRSTQNELRYPVVQDNGYAIWNAFGNKYWPAKYLIDARGPRALHPLRRGRLRGRPRRPSGRCWPRPATAAWAPAPAAPGDRARQGRPDARDLLRRQARPGLAGGARSRAPGPTATRGRPPLNAFALGGRWRVTGESATAVRDATVSARFRARRVYLVLRSADRRRRAVRVRVDGGPAARWRCAATTSTPRSTCRGGRARPEAGLRPRA